MKTPRLLLSTLFALACAARVLAQTPAAGAPAQPAAAPAPAQPTVTVQGAEPAKNSVSRDKDTLSVDFPDEDIKNILRNVADLFELNLVVPDTLTGKTSIKLRDVTWRQIFQVVLAPVNYTYVEEGNIIKIISNETLLEEPTVTDVIILNNAKAADIKPTIDGLVDAAKGGKILIDARSNALVITERPSRMSRIRATIEQLDKATDQVMIESKFVEVTDRDIRNIGVNWASLQGMQLGVGNLRQSFTQNQGQTRTDGNNTTNGTTSITTNTTTNTNNNLNGTTGSTTNSNTASNNTTFTVVPQNVDVNTGAFGPIPGTTTLNLPSGAVTGLPPTVASFPTVSNFVPQTTDPTTGAVTPASFTAPVTSTTGTNSTTASGTTSSTSVGTAITNTLTNGANNAVNALTGLTNTSSVGRVATAVFSASDFNVIVSALKQMNNTKVVSNPTIVTLNNTEATINIGSEFPVPSYTYNSERGTFEVSGFTYKPIGIILKVTPQVNARGVIKLNLEPEVSQQNGSTSFGGAGGAQIPIIATRKIKTQVSLKDGYTMGLGGLITTARDHGGSKVPVLGSIPLLGRLFSSKNVNDSSTNLLIFVTARTVSADGASPEEVFTPSAIESTGMTRDELPGHRAPKGTDLFPAKPEKKK
ncbi:MAG: secretin and TonB N-terminal domain-containing protein [Opitutae bacterium]|nr:secretin and TonB N-terminal domain-containing protein [Opitutae bacterium]